jgi:hypothetical protein
MPDPAASSAFTFLLNQASLERLQTLNWQPAN